MKAVLSGVYAGAGGKQPISITGDLSIQGLNVEALLDRVAQLEEHVVKLEGVVSRLQEQSMRSCTKELAKALEEAKAETVVAESVATVTVQEEVKPTTSTGKKKSV
ncbi:MAG: hypothetical protein EBU90_30925 [Proteobacteria bacterium]|nr:hypothetical protein [Pseudomonadota bacterium]